MSSRFKNGKIASVAAGLGILVAGMFGACAANAQGNLSFTVTPPLFQLSVGPGNNWTSAVTVVNSSSFDITVYARAVAFEPSGEDGRGTLLPAENLGTSTLSGWITLSPEPIVIPREQTIRIPFSIVVPKDAPPGGHYAAILVSTAPAEGKGTINVASSIASLIFLNAGGEVEEVGVIRDFYPDRSLVTGAEAALTLRFENRGNVHLRPVGYITITNMWGRPRGTITIGGSNEFGNVLPATIRKFRFTWRGDDAQFDIGRYKAEATLSFGSDAKQNITRAAYFWVVPVVPVAKVLGAVFAMAFFLIWGMRRYVRHAIRLEAERLGVDPSAAIRAAEAPRPHGQPPRTQAEALVPRVTLSTLVRPLKPASATDLRAQKLPLAVAESEEKPLSHAFFQYWFLGAFMLVAAVSVAWLNVFFKDVLTYERDFEIAVEKDDGETATFSATSSAAENAETEP